MDLAEGELGAFRGSIHDRPFEKRLGYFGDLVSRKLAPISSCFDRLEFDIDFDVRAIAINIAPLYAIG